MTGVEEPAGWQREEGGSGNDRARPAGSAWGPGEVAALRRRLGLTQAGMARLLGVRQQTVSEWETGLHRPRGASVRLLRLLAEERAPYDPGPPEPHGQRQAARRGGPAPGAGAPGQEPA